MTVCLCRYKTTRVKQEFSFRVPFLNMVIPHSSFCHWFFSPWLISVSMCLFISSGDYGCCNGLCKIHRDVTSSIDFYPLHSGLLPQQWRYKRCTLSLINILSHFKSDAKSLFCSRLWGMFSKEEWLLLCGPSSLPVHGLLLLQSIPDSSQGHEDHG